ncbi:MAG TPA: flagellar hook basal-body protein [Terriglobia bacterium]|nr:flagellar hook basal-body protein [Terriglobia bacterium]
MNSGFYSALTGLMARFQSLNLLAGNLANVSTTGYKAQVPFYEALDVAQGRAATAPLNQAINDFGVLGGSQLDRQPGSIEHTGSSLDIALRGPGFLVAQTPAGIRYTRNGSLQLGSNGELLSASGDPILGAKGPIRLPEGPVSISADGLISVNGTLVDRLQVMDFPHNAPMLAEGNSYFTAPANLAQPDLKPQIIQGALESSNYNAITGVVNLITLQRQADLLQRAVAIFYTIMDAAAVQQLPSVPAS